MLQRLYVDNYRSLINFEFRPGSLCLLLGDNGSGKTTILDVVEMLRDFISGQSAATVFSHDSLTRWQLIRNQTFEADFMIDGKIYTYSLVIEHVQHHGLSRVQQELLNLDGRPLYSFKDGEAQLYRDDHSQGPRIPLDWSRSGIGFLHTGPTNCNIRKFREHVAGIVVIGLIPCIMSSESDSEISVLDRRGQKFVSWYRAMALENPAGVSKLGAILRDIMPGFSALPLRETGSMRVLKAQFDSPESTQKSRFIEYDFKELSDGQRAIIVLYSLLYMNRGNSFIFWLDEPDNYVSLREIQPWLSELEECCAEVDQNPQAILVSHHPEMINYIGANRIVLLERDCGGPTRVKPFLTVPGLSGGETVARGWE